MLLLCRVATEPHSNMSIPHTEAAPVYTVAAPVATVPCTHTEIHMRSVLHPPSALRVTALSGSAESQILIWCANNACDEARGHPPTIADASSRAHGSAPRQPNANALAAVRVPRSSASLQSPHVAPVTTWGSVLRDGAWLDSRARSGLFFETADARCEMRWHGRCHGHFALSGVRSIAAPFGAESSACFAHTAGVMQQ